MVLGSAFKGQYLLCSLLAAGFDLDGVALPKFGFPAFLKDD
jgi:hypothetical protein